MQPSKTKAIVLRRTNYGEADRIINAITPDYGKISMLAKGVRRPKSRLAGGLELLAVCDLTFVSGRGMSRVTSARLQVFYDKILLDYDRLTLAYEFIRQINRVAEIVGEPDFYNLLQASLEHLNDSTIDWRLTSLWFKMHLRGLLGQAVNLATDRQSNKLLSGKKYSFDFLENAFYEDERGNFTDNHIKFLRLVAAKNLNVLKNIGGAGAIMDDCLQLLTALET